ncbi:MAG: hypothetical protein CMJ24_07030 [Phycisphaerae bacterium]|nr:hypothetical protein [Phycisphaerae bacterium]
MQRHVRARSADSIDRPLRSNVMPDSVFRSVIVILLVFISVAVGWIAVDSTMSNRRMERTLRTIRAAAVVEQVVQGTGQFGVLNKDGFFTNVMMREFREDIEDEYEFDPNID